MEEELNSNIYTKLRNIRRARGLSVNKLAEKMGENHQKVGRIERGKSNLTIDYLLKLSKALDAPIDSIIREEETNEPSPQENHQLLSEIVLLVEQHAETLIPKNTPEKKAQLISTLYTEAMKVPKEHQKSFISTLIHSLLLLSENSLG